VQRSNFSQHLLIADPIGATAVLVFGMPDSPLAQTRDLLVGNLIGAILSVLCVHFFGNAPWVMALAIAATIKLMKMFRAVHPGAVALVGVMSGASWTFIFTPVLFGSLLILLVTYIFNNLALERSYPRHWL